MLSSFNPTQTAAVFVAFLIAFPVESDGGGEAAINQGRCFGGPSLSVPPTARPGRAGSSSRGPKPRPIAGSRRGRSPLPRSYPLGQGGRGRGPPERDGPQQGRSLPPPSPATPPAPRFPDPGIHVSGTRTGLRRRRDGRSGAAQQLLPEAGGRRGARPGPLARHRCPLGRGQPPSAVPAVPLTSHPPSQWRRTCPASRPSPLALLAHGAARLWQQHTTSEDAEPTSGDGRAEQAG